MIKEDFITKIANACAEIAPKFNICVISPIIAQAICETGCEQIENETGLFPYNNFFGMKCGGVWTGKSVNMATMEEYEAGVLTPIRDNFRVYDTFEDGVFGYFDFIDWDNYANLKGVTDPYTYCSNLKTDGYATSSTYVGTLMSIINSYNLTQYDELLVKEEKPANKYNVGDKVKYSGIYATSMSTDKQNSYFNEGVITDIVEDANNPYLIGGGTGWTNDECISGLLEEKPVVETVKPAYDLDDLVKRTIRGEFGNGSKRRENLEAIEAGLFDKVQEKVNNILG